jgi:hypothetical protein
MFYSGIMAATGALAELQKTAVICVMSVGLEQIGYNWTYLKKFLQFNIFKNLYQTFKLRSNRTIMTVVYVKTYIHFLSYLAQFWLKFKMFLKGGVEKTETYILLKTIISKSYRLWDKGGKYCWAGKAGDDNIAHAQFMLDNLDYKHV